MCFTLIQSQPPVVTQEEKIEKLNREQAISSAINLSLFSGLFLISLGTFIKLTMETEKHKNIDIEYRKSASIASTTVKYLDSDENQIEQLERYKKFVFLPMMFSLVGTAWNSFKLKKTITISVKKDKKVNNTQEE